MALKTAVAVVTGAAGNLGTEITKQLLDQGYTVRASVRDASKAQHLEALGKALPGTLELFEADMTVAGSHDKVTKDATYVFHAAGILSFGTGNKEQDQKDLVDPIVAGTKNVLESAAKSKSVKRIILTSSTVAIFSNSDEVYPLTERDWNVTADISSAYLFSKVQAERAAWKLAEKLNIDLVVLNPSIILGPVTSTRDRFSSSRVKIILEGGAFDQTFPFMEFCDVRDVSRAHILAAELPHAHGRYIVSHEYETSNKDAARWLKAEFPRLPILDPPEGQTKRKYDTSKAREELGLQLMPLEKTFRDHARSLVALGLVKAP